MFPTITYNPDYTALEPKIRPLVRAINRLGIATLWSCQGHKEFTMIGASVPTVVISVEHSPGLTILFRLVGIFNHGQSGLIKTTCVFVPYETHLSLEMTGMDLKDLQSKIRELVKIIRKGAQRKP